MKRFTETIFYGALQRLVQQPLAVPSRNPTGAAWLATEVGRLLISLIVTGHCQ
jgi:hypothetical protein